MSSRQHTLSGLSMMSGAFVAAVPAAILSISANQFATAVQGYVAVAIAISMFVAQLTYAATVESRLSSVGSSRQVSFPRWLIILTIAAAAILLVFNDSSLVVFITLPFLLAGLEVGRGVAVAERRDASETLAAIIVGVGAFGGIGLSLLDAPFALGSVALGVLVATLIRAKRVETRPQKPSAGVRRWILIDTSVTGITFPLLNVIILGQLGASEVFLFSAIATVSGVLAIPLTFMRMRLLKEHSVADILLPAAAIFVGLAVLGVLEFSGFFGLIFGAEWTLEATLWPLFVAALWRAASLLTTIPFASLRRLGDVKLLTGLRVIAAALMFSFALLGLSTANLTGVFFGLLLAELASAAIFETARRMRIRTPRTQDLQ